MKTKKQKKSFSVLVRLFLIGILFGLLPQIGFSETVGIFYNQSTPQHVFAAGDIKTALESKSFTVELLNLSALSSSYASKKVVIALESDAVVKTLLSTQGGSTVPTLGEQAYVLRTTTNLAQSYWVFGGDANGAMYGGLEIAENINFNGYSGTYNSQESPSILKRGIKLNYGLDVNSPTYFSSFSGTSYKKAIPNVWDMTYWTTWIDEMARNRYNVLSVWNNHPFTSMIKLPDYPNVAIQNVTGFDGYSKVMTIDEKIVFWKQIMAYAHSRGFEFFLFNWNIFVSNASGQYGLSNGTASSANTTYMYKCMVKLLETYPDLDGFGVTNGESGSTVKFLWDTYGKGIYDYAIANPQRKFQFIHRWHQANFTDIKNYFGPLMALPKLTFDMSFKYAEAHMYSTPVPKWWSTSNINDLNANNLKTWFTLRNDDYYYHNWGDPDFARNFVEGIPGKGTYLRGFYMGSDGYSPTRTFFSKNSATQGLLEIQRQWYMYKLWGRLSYNPATSTDVFKNFMKLKYPTVSSDDLFTAWSKASKGLPLVTELTQATLRLDFDWWPEACWSENGFVSASTFSNAGVGSGSLLRSISNSASNTGSGKTSYVLADEIEADAKLALSLVSGMNANANTELGVNINNIRAMSYLSLYYAYKIRGATYMKANDSRKTAALGTAYCYWMKYSNLMSSMYDGMTMQRVDDLPDWHSVDAAVLAEYNSNGGSGTPPPTDCDIYIPVTGVTVSPNPLTINGIGVEGQLTKTVLPTSATNQNVTWWSSDDLIATVDANGKVKSVALGNAVITVKTVEGNFTATCNVTVVPAVTYTLNVIINPPGGGTVTGGGTYNSGTPVTLTAIPNSGYKFDNWSGDLSGTTNPTTITMNSNKSVTANFSACTNCTNVSLIGSWVKGTTHVKEAGINRALVVMLYGEGSGNISASTVTYGGHAMTKVVEKAYLSGAYSYTGAFVLNEAGVSAASSGTIAVTWSTAPSTGSDATSAFFDNVNQTTLTGAFASNGQAGTTITTSSLANTSGDMVLVAGTAANNGTYTINNSFTRGIAETSAAFGDITSAYKSATGANETPSLTMSASMRQTIVGFVLNKVGGTPVQYTITSTAGAGGSISPSGSVVVDSSASQAFVITPSSCNIIQDVIVDGISQGAITLYTFDDVTNDHTISATFVGITYTLTTSAGSGGTITPGGIINCGDNKTIVITPEPCCQVDNVIVDGASIGAVNTYTFSNVSGNHTVSATFKQANYTLTATAGIGGTITPNGSKVVNCGANQAYTITPDNGYVVNSVTVDGNSQGAITTYEFTNVTANHTINALFREEGTDPNAIAINCGGPAYTAIDGTVYSADAYFTGGSTYSTIDPIANTTDDALYQSERWGASLYNIPLSNGTYLVTLKFAEINFTTVGSRVFNVTVEGNQVISNLDIYAQVGHDAPYDVTVPVTLNDGELNISFINNVENPKISAISVKQSTNLPDVVALTGWVSGATNNKVAGSNRMMVLMVMGESNANFSATGVTYGGQAMTKQTDKIYYVSGNRTYASIFTLNETGVNAAINGTITVTWSATPSVGSSINSVLLGNVDQTTPVSAPLTNSLTGTTITTTALSTASGDMVIMCGATESNNTVTFNNSFTKQFESNSSWGDGVCGNKLGSGSNETPSFTQSASGRMVLCALVAKKSALKSATIGSSLVENSVDNFVKVYPNPVSNTLYVNHSDAQSVTYIKIYNMHGQMLYNKQATGSVTAVDVKELKSTGLIFVQVSSGKDISTFKVSVVK